MSDLPEIRNEPHAELSRGDLEDFGHSYRTVAEQRARDDDEPRKPRARYIPTLLIVIVVLVGGWHCLAAQQLEDRLTKHLVASVQENLPDASLSVDVQPLTNLVDIQLTRKVARNEASFELLGDVIIEYVRIELEPRMERELSARARRDVDLYAMLVPYQVSISVDKVRAPPPSPPSRMVQEIQRQLQARGYDPGPADGRMGERTRNAIARFQRDNALTDDGRATDDLLELLRKE